MDITREALEALVKLLFGPAFRITQTFSSTHDGLDLAAPKGTPVYALVGGWVRHARFAGDDCAAHHTCNGGNVVNIEYLVGQHKNIIQYAHLDRINPIVKEGEYVEPGQLIGYVGETGTATGPHLHLAVRWGTEWIDPARFLNDVAKGLVPGNSPGRGGSIDIGSAIAGIGEMINAPLRFLTDANNWLRLLALGAGVGLLVLGIRRYS